VLTNRVSVEIVNRDDEEEPVPINVVVVPAPTVPTRPPTTDAPATNRLMAVSPVPRPPATPSLRRENPAPEAVRSVWARQLAGRDWPAGARQWVPKLKPVFVAEGVPAELVWLAEVESGFDPRARSPAGAVGLYQLMPVTARSLGLGSFPLDQRKSPEKSSRAAAQYLRQLYGQFGDWPLALAAYNAGPTRVRSLLTAHGASTFGGIARRLPVETQLYVPKFDAVLQLREGRALKDLRPPVLTRDPAAAEGRSADP
jgi:membrane-bound lytic murein transglycosylase D